MHNQIPKVIHYCWFGGNPLPEMAIKCIDSWKKYCPDYEIVEWNEKNFDIDSFAYAREAYEAKKWAFVSDVARLYALVEQGGIYMDTDVELVKGLESILDYEAVSGFENDKDIPTGLMASIPHQSLFEELLSEYNDLHFVREDSSYDLTTNVVRITNTCLKYGFKPNNSMQTIKGFTILPKDYLCPKDYETGEIIITENTIAIHHFESSWHSEDAALFAKLTKKYNRLFANQFMRYLCKFYCILKCYGAKKTMDYLVKWIKKKN